MRSTITRFERLEVGVLAEFMCIRPNRSVQDVINEPSRCPSRCSWHEIIRTRTVDRPLILIASTLFPIPLCDQWGQVPSARERGILKFLFDFASGLVN